MHEELIRDYCLTKKGISESFPFDDTTLVFKVMGKMFALLSLDGDLSLNLKCNPEKALALREKYPGVLPGYHMNKANWNTIIVDGSISYKLITTWIDDSYNLVVATLSKKLQGELNQL